MKSFAFPPPGVTLESCRVPKVDVVETNFALRLIADLPGAEVDLIETRLTDEYFFLYAPIRQVNWESAKDLLVLEYAPAKFYYRRLRVPAVEELTAPEHCFMYGVLTITANKKTVQPRKKITVVETNLDNHHFPT